MIRCSQCNHENDDRQRRPQRCEECGAELKGVSPTDSRLEKTVAPDDHTLACSHSSRTESHSKQAGNDDHPLILGINVNQFYMQGFKGVLDLKLANCGLEDIDSATVEVSSDLLEHIETWHCQLACARAVYKKFQIKADSAGIELIRFRVVVQRGASFLAFWAEADIPVFEKTQDLRNISIQADNIVGVGSVAEHAKSMGNAVRGQMDSLIRMDKIRNATDLMREYRTMAPDYFHLTLESDPQRSQQLTESLSASRTGHGNRIIDASRGTLTDGASLEVQGGRAPHRIVLLAKSEVTLGKHRSCDIVTRILPRSPQQDELSNRISRTHARIELSTDGLWVTDNQTVNGTRLDGQLLDSQRTEIGDQARCLELAEVLTLDTCISGNRTPVLDLETYSDLLIGRTNVLWEHATHLGFNALALHRRNNLDASDPTGTESYYLVFRGVTLGSDAGCAVSIPDRGLEPMHALLLHFNGQFYLENVSQRSSVSVNTTAISSKMLIPLCFGDCIRIAECDLKFESARQIGL